MSRGFTGGNFAGGNKSDLTKKKSLMAALNYSRNRKKTLNENGAGTLNPQGEKLPGYG